MGHESPLPEHESACNVKKAQDVPAFYTVPCWGVNRVFTPGAFRFWIWRDVLTLVPGVGVEPTWAKGPRYSKLKFPRP